MDEQFAVTKMKYRDALRIPQRWTRGFPWSTPARRN